MFEGQDVDAAVRAWMGDVALRDYLLDPGRSMFGVGKGKHACVLELFHPKEPMTKGAVATWPRDGQKAVPSGHEGVGSAMSLHFFREVDATLLQQVACIVRVGGQQVPGTLVELQGKGVRGCVAFTPSSPLPPGECEVVWTVPVPLLGGKDVAQPRARFVVQ